MRPVGPGLGFEGWRPPSAPQPKIQVFGEIFGEKMRIFFGSLHPAIFLGGFTVQGSLAGLEVIPTRFPAGLSRLQATFFGGKMKPFLIRIFSLR